MLLNGYEVSDLGTLGATLETAVWMRREQFRIFETMINVLAQGLTVSPEIGKKVQKLINEYMELVAPGSEAARKKNERDFIKNTAYSLNEITELLRTSGSAHVKRSTSPFQR